MCVYIGIQVCVCVCVYSCARVCVRIQVRFHSQEDVGQLLLGEVERVAGDREAVAPPVQAVVQPAP